jgi:S1-C subfamily serine protease
MIRKFTIIIGLISLASAFLGCGSPSAPYTPPVKPVVVPYVAVRPQVDVLKASCRVLVEQHTTKQMHGQKYIETVADAGSGTLVGPGRVITNHHVVKDRNARSQLVVVFNGTRYPFTVLREDSVADLAVLEVPVIITEGVVVQPVDVDPFAIGLVKPNTTFIGFGPGELKVVVGNHVKTLKGDGYEWSIVDKPNRSGDSGGGVYNAFGTFVGVQWGCDRKVGHTYTSTGEPLSKILKEPRR